MTLGESLDPRSMVASGMRSRTFKRWRVLWGLGGLLSIPDEDAEKGVRCMDERITAFSWAKFVEVGRALLAYMNDDEEIVIYSVGLFQQGVEKGAKEKEEEDEARQRVQEMIRFDGRGPHDVSRPRSSHSLNLENLLICYAGC